MRVLVTGASGFVGAHILERLGGHDVVALSRSEQSDARFLIGDVLDPAALKKAATGCEIVIHAAGLVDHRESAAARLSQTHVRGTENVLAAARAAGARRVVYLSTSGTVAVSANADDVADEASPTPRDLIAGWPYYRSKLYAEEVALSAADDGLEVVSLNPSLLLGPGDRNGSSTAAVRLFLDGQVPFAPRGGLSFADVRDVADTVVAAIDHGDSGQRYLLGAANMTFRLFYERLARIAELPAPRLDAPAALTTLLDWFPSVGREGFPIGELNRIDLQMSAHTWYLDDRLARQSLGWSPRDPLETLADTVTDLKLALARGRNPSRAGAAP